MDEVFQLFVGLVFLVWLARLALASARRSERAELARFAADLPEGGQVLGSEGQPRVVGRRDGRLLHLDPGPPPVMSVHVAHPVGELELFDARAQAPTGWEVELVARDGGASADWLFQHEATREAALELFEHDEVQGLELRAGWLRATLRVLSPRADALLRLSRRLARLAALCDRHPVTGWREPGRRAFVWSGGGEAARCPYCHDGLDPAAADVAACADCGTLHHAECLEEAGGCTVLGCRGRSGGDRVRV